MGKVTAISWCDATWNPWWGCARVSDGCRFCYAETLAARWGHDVWGERTGRRFFGDKHWAEPVTWNRDAEAAGTPKLVFCASMADVFEDHEGLDEQRARLWPLVENTPWLRWLLLTKRPQNILDMVPPTWLIDWPPHVWAGTTVEHQAAADERVPVLLDVPSALRFVSAEPLLGPVQLRPEWMELELQAFGAGGVKCFPRVDWVIAGGESGPHHRPLDPDWVRALRDQCVDADVAFHFKQVGGRTPKAGGKQLDGVEWCERPDPGPSLVAVAR